VAIVDLDVASVITAVGGAVALVLKALSVHRRTRHRALEARLTDVEARLLGWAEWAHDARMAAAAAGCRLPAVPQRLLGLEEVEPA
jgi:hypothetical protein